MHSIKRSVRSTVVRTFATLAVSLAAVSCGGGGSQVKSDIVFSAANTSQPEQWAYHKLGSNDEVVLCSAQIDSNPEGVFEFKLTRKFNVVAVKLSVNLVSREGDKVTLAEATMQPVLFLEDGTALEYVDPATLRKDVDKKRLPAFDRNIFEDKLLQDLGLSETKAEGYLFFQLPGDSLGEDVELTVSGPNGSAYLVNLRRSLVRFTYERDQEGRKTLSTINVGTK